MDNMILQRNTVIGEIIEEIYHISTNNRNCTRDEWMYRNKDEATKG